MQLSLIYPANQNVVPEVLDDEINHLVQNVTIWLTANPNNDLTHYKHIARNRGFQTGYNAFNCLPRKAVDLYHNQKRIVIEIETSTIENSYNDMLKMLVLYNQRLIDYGAIIFVQNNRGGSVKLDENQINNVWVDGYREILNLFNGNMFLYHLTL